MTLHLEIVTPTQVLYSEDVDEVIAPTVQGVIAILPNHVGLLTKLKEGELLIKKGGKTEPYAVLGGFMEVKENNVNIIAEYAIHAENIEVAKAQEAHDRAKKTMEERKGREDFALAEGELRKSILELKVAKKYRPKLNRS